MPTHTAASRLTLSQLAPGAIEAIRNGENIYACRDDIAWLREL